jgi:small-conductance mechanosensitive channel
VLVLLAADLVWHLIRSWIDRRLFEAADGMPAAGIPGGEGEGGGDAPSQPALPPDEARHRARLLTLLPILRNAGFVVFAVMAGLTAFSALGVQVGSLLAGAGVVGIAVGFGAQTLVKDVISGLFFLLDDAFRVGEYIESGSVCGTVEAFSLRSVKLRHHRGYLHTVPFGSLDTITNYSRDWVIDKVTIGLSYDADLDKVKRIIKQVGKDLLADPELAPSIIETPKMQGVESYGDIAVQIRLKMTTKPGEQFVIRRRAYALIKKAFDENGIRFAFPTVQVAGGEPADGGAVAAAAAQAALGGAPKPAAA